ncbi:DUF4031 domain-containing protein [Curtobacterium flaccumfaciens]|uniref:DUF4031 domain-containing protein n=1 Tax=Curtobacterium flaccumfaciens TaxID=2035 RepID=UPI001AD9C9F9|nr:DUF4031 domain-containing protein [Curtobacterium flaccumfaciens]MBO9049525.1 DUF4031 domain-containing protein [Curtobacterium flaccumfaciens pv. flaccumfaciens]
MVLYVDDMRVRATVRGYRTRWSHLYADSSQELLAFARVIGLRADWIQQAGTPFEHFDVAESKRQAAVAAGANPISCVQTGVLLAHRVAALRVTA